jgi:hypothetical protein
VSKGVEVELAGRRWPVHQRCTIGRASTAEICIDRPGISRRHAELDPRPEGCRLRDLGSRNGTYVDGDRVGADWRILRDGDRIVLGGEVELVVHDPMATPFTPTIGRLTGLWIDPQSKAVWTDAQQMEPPLSAQQQAVLETLYAANGEIVDRSSLIAAAWPDVAAEGVTDDALTALLKRLRHRLGDGDRPAPFVEVVRGRGVRLRIDP